MMSRMGKAPQYIAVVTKIFPSYRLDSYRDFIAQHGDRLSTYCQKCIPGMGLQGVHDQLRPDVYFRRHLTALKEKVGWQFLPLRRLLRQDVISFTATHGSSPMSFSRCCFSYLAALKENLRS
jgi:hypothetical protein